MLRIDNHNVNFSGQSFDNEKMLGSFNASYYGNTDIQTSINVADYAMSQEEKEVFLTDVLDFYQEIIEKVSIMVDQPEEEKEVAEEPVE